jgi:hypothetical protein
MKKGNENKGDENKKGTKIKIKDKMEGKGIKRRK